MEGLDHYAPNRHDTGSTTARSVDEVALTPDTKRLCAWVDRIFINSQIVEPAARKKFQARRPVSSEGQRPGLALPVGCTNSLVMGTHRQSILGHPRSARW